MLPGLTSRTRRLAAAKAFNMEGIMQKIIGIICLLIGLWLLWCGYNVEQSFGSSVVKTFTGSPLSKATHNYIAGIIVGGIGAFLIFWKGKKI